MKIERTLEELEKEKKALGVGKGEGKIEEKLKG